jgi:hypothetical protein
VPVSAQCIYHGLFGDNFSISRPQISDQPIVDVRRGPGPPREELASMLLRRWKPSRNLGRSPGNRPATSISLPPTRRGRRPPARTLLHVHAAALLRCPVTRCKLLQLLRPEPSPARPGTVTCSTDSSSTPVCIAVFTAEARYTSPFVCSLIFLHTRGGWTGCMRVLFQILELFVGNMYDRFACMDYESMIELL